MTSKKEDPNEAAARKAREHLQRIEQQSEKILGASGSDEPFDSNDPIEIWGKRIGFGLSLLLGVYLVYHFYTTYFA